MSKRDKTNYVFKMISQQKINKSRAQEVNSKTTITENPLAMLSIKNYDLICKNDEIKKKMASFLKIKESKLTEYCKDINSCNRRATCLAFCIPFFPITSIVV